MHMTISVRKISGTEKDKIKAQIRHGGRKSQYEELLRTMDIGDMLELSEPLNRGTISRISKKLGYTVSASIVEGKMYLERTA